MNEQEKKERDKYYKERFEMEARDEKLQELRDEDRKEYLGGFDKEEEEI